LSVRAFFVTLARSIEFERSGGVNLKIHVTSRLAAGVISGREERGGYPPPASSPTDVVQDRAWESTTLRSNALARRSAGVMSTKWARNKHVPRN